MDLCENLNLNVYALSTFLALKYSVLPFLNFLSSRALLSYK